MTAFQGSFVALVTPFRNGKVDEAKLRELVEFHAAHGTDGVIPCGTTGESPTLSHDEHKRVVGIVVEAARKQKAHVVGLSVLSGSHLPLVEDVVGRMKRAGLDVPVIVGGIIPPEDAAQLEKAGVAAVYTPKDFELNRIMSDVVRIVERAKGSSNV